MTRRGRVGPDGEIQSRPHRPATLAAVAALSLLALSSPGNAQYRGQVQVEAVVAPVTVRDSSGKIVGMEIFHGLLSDGSRFWVNLGPIDTATKQQWIERQKIVYAVNQPAGDEGIPVLLFQRPLHLGILRYAMQDAPASAQCH